jgi:putative Mg2+ transporter-C (MgtC) family protein
LELDTIDVVLRLVAAAAIGALLGINRDMKQKPIGSRTLGLVALGSASVSLAGLQVPGMAGDADATSRVVQGIIQGIMGGISFIGAGVVLRDPKAQTVEGLTTAATVWATAALGIACALAAWTIVIVGTVLTIALLISTDLINRVTNRNPSGETNPPNGTATTEVP